MGLVRNLKKTLSSLAEKILVELSYHYIVQLAKQTSKKRDSSLQTTYLQNHLTTEHQHTTIATSSAGTSEKIITNATTEDIVAHIREWSLNRVSDTNVSKEDARAIMAEFYEWIEPEDDELEIVSLEPES